MSKRRSPSQDLHDGFPVKRAKTGTSLRPGKSHNPTTRYRNHQASGVGEGFHSVPYPLSLTHFDNWYVLHHKMDVYALHQFQCPKCKKPRAPTPHQRKLFLVAERLTWEKGQVPSRDVSKNEEQLWEVNHHLGITEPVMVELDDVPGREESRENPFFPFESEDEMEASMKLLGKAEKLSDHAFQMWRMTLDSLPEMPGPGETPLNKLSASQSNARCAPGSNGIPVPPSSVSSGSGPIRFMTSEEKAREITKRMAELSGTDPTFSKIFKQVTDGRSTTFSELNFFSWTRSRIAQEIEAECLPAPKITPMATPTALSGDSSIRDQQVPDSRMFEVRWDIAGHLKSRRMYFSELTEVMRKRLDDDFQNSTALTTCIANVKAGNATSLEHTVVQTRLHRICDNLIIQRQTLEQELLAASYITRIPSAVKWQHQPPQTREMGGGVDPVVCHMILARSTEDRLILRLLHRAHQRKLTYQQRGLFWDTIGLHEWFVQTGMYPWAFGDVLSRMASIDSALVDAFHNDPMFYLDDLRHFDPPTWSRDIATAARERFPSPDYLMPQNPNAQAMAPLLRVHACPSQVQDPKEVLLKSRKPLSFTTLPDLYALLDKIERTSYVASQYLEAYAEFLNRDVCGNCWFSATILEDKDFEIMDKAFGLFGNEDGTEEDEEIEGEGEEE